MYSPALSTPTNDYVKDKNYTGDIKKISITKYHDYILFAQRDFK